MPSTLPDFGTKIRNGNEERIEECEQTQTETKRCREERSQKLQVGRRMTEATN